MRGRHGIPALLLVGANLLLPVQRSSACTTITQTSITTDTVWGPSGFPADTCYTIQNSITISGSATLTIQAGTVVRFAAGRSLTVGLGTPGSLQAIGSGANPVVFTSSADSGPGGWGGLIFQNESDASGAFSVLSNCVIHRGGSGGHQIQIVSSNAITLTDCLISEHSGFGLNLSNSVPNATGCTFKDFGGYAATGFIPDVGLLFANNVFVPNGSGQFNAIQLKSATLTQTASLSTPDAGFCYITDGGDINVGLEPNDPVLTIGTNTVLKFASGSRLLTGSGGANGGLIAKGAVFTSAQDDTLGDTSGNGITAGAPGQWEGILLESATIDASTSLDSCVVRYAGQANSVGIRITSCEPTITRCVIRNNSTYGLRVNGAAVTAGAVTNNLLRDNGTYEISAVPRAMEHLVPFNQVLPSLDGRYNGYEVVAGTVTNTSVMPTPPSGFCYITEADDVDIGLEPNDPILTIGNSSVLKFRGGARLLTGSGGANGGLIARGVIFTSASDDTLGDTDGGGPSSGAAGQWEGILLESATIDASTVLDSCQVRFAGQTNNVGIRITSCEPTITRSVIRNNSVYGLRVNGSSVTAGGVTNNLLRDNGTYEISAVPRAMEHLVPFNQIVPSSDGRYNGYEVVAGTVTVSALMPTPQAGFCYITEADDIDIGLEPNDPVLTIGTRTVIKFRAGARLLTGSGGANGGLIAKGVVFTSSLDDTVGDSDGNGASSGAAGQWEGILLESATIDPSTSLDSCVIRFAGQTNSVGVRITSCEPTITRCVIRNNSVYGLRVNGATTTAGSVTNNLLRANGTYEISAVPRAMEHLVQNNQVEPSQDGRYNGYELVAGTVTVSSLLPTPPPGFCYISENGDIDIGLEPNDPILTIAPHTVIKMRSAARLLTGNGGANGGLIAKGVVFTSSLDDTLGDTDGNGASVGAPGQWEGILFESATMDDYAVISCSTVRFAGGGGINAGIRATNSRPSIPYSVITRNNLRGVAVIGSTGRADLFGSLITDNGTGVEASSNAAPYLERCSIVGNATAGLTNLSAGVTVQAVSCWWGSSTGPTNPSNPGGTGQIVSGPVAFTPWLTTEPARPCDLAVGVELPSVAYDAAPDRIKITWSVPDRVGQLLRVSRSDDRVEWKPVVSATVPADGHVEFMDVNLTPVSTYIYRLSAGEHILAETTIQTPAALVLAIQSPKPNPARLPVRFEFTVPDRAPVSIDLIDLAGRRLFQDQLNGLDPGTHSFEIPGSPAIHSGVYYIRVASRGRIATAPLVIMR